MNDHETPRRARTDQGDDPKFDELAVPSAAGLYDTVPPYLRAPSHPTEQEQKRSSGDDTAGSDWGWFEFLDVGVTWLIPSGMVAVVSMGVFWVMEAYRAFHTDPMLPEPMQPGWVIPGGVAVGLAFMGCVYLRRPEAEKERGLKVMATLFFLAAVLAGAIASALLPAASG